MSAILQPITGDVEIAKIGALLADRARCRVLMALHDGRALPASVLAAEAGVSRSTASGHIGKLTEAGLLTVEAHGRHRYYRLAGDQVGELLEKLRGPRRRSQPTDIAFAAGRGGVGFAG